MIEAVSNVTCEELSGSRHATLQKEVLNHSYPRRPDFLNKSLQIAKYARENLVLLDVYLREPYAKLFVRREKITIIR